MNFNGRNSCYQYNEPRQEDSGPSGGDFCRRATEVMRAEVEMEVATEVATVETGAGGP